MYLNTNIFVSMYFKKKYYFTKTAHSTIPHQIASVTTFMCRHQFLFIKQNRTYIFIFFYAKKQ